MAGEDIPARRLAARALLAGMIALLCWLIWVSFPGMAAIGLRFGITRTASKRVLNSLRPRALKQLMDSEGLGYYGSIEWWGLMCPMLRKVDQRPKQLEQLLKSLPCPSYASPTGKTLLHIAAYANCPTACKHLVAAGLDPNEVDALGRTACHFAVKRGHILVLKALVEVGAKPALANHDGDNSLHYAARGSRGNVVAWLLERGVQPNVANKWGEHALHLAAKEGDSESVSLLLASGAEPNARDAHGNTALHRAVQARSLSVVECLKKSGANLALRNSEDMTPLDVAMCYGYPEIAPIVAAPEAIRPEVRVKQQDQRSDKAEQ